MSKVLILVEGQTEETFVSGVLAPYLSTKGVHPIATLAATKRVKRGKVFKGGVVSYGKVKNDIRRLLHDTSTALVTTMLDFYGLPTDFPEYDTMPPGTCYQRIEHLEEAFKKDIAHHKFLPYLELHEFEAMMFASPEKISNAFPETKKLEKLHEIKNIFSSPEEINEEKPPSKRLEALFPGYDKPVHGFTVTDEIGIEAIRRECSHFDGWLKQLEELGT